MEEDIKWYVVTCNGRRIEERNYYTKMEVENRSESLKNTLRRWKDPDAKRIKIRRTKHPDKIK